MQSIQIKIKNRNIRNLIQEVLTFYESVFNTHIGTALGQLVICDSDCRLDHLTSHETIVVGKKVVGFACVGLPFDRYTFLRILIDKVEKRTAYPIEVILGKRRLEKVSVATIQYIETKGRHLEIVTASRVYKNYETITTWKQRLKKWPFSEVYRGILVNLNYVMRLESCELEMKDGKIVPVSRRRFCSVQNIYRSMMK